MSGYNYSDSTNCASCNTRNLYTPLDKTMDYDCGSKCLCRFNHERTVKDRMYYDIFVLGKNVPDPAPMSSNSHENFVMNSRCLPCNRK